MGFKDITSGKNDMIWLTIKAASNCWYRLQIPNYFIGWRVKRATPYLIIKGGLKFSSYPLLSETGTSCPCNFMELCFKHNSQILKTCNYLEQMCYPLANIENAFQANHLNYQGPLEAFTSLLLTQTKTAWTKHFPFFYFYMENSSFEMSLHTR